MARPRYTPQEIGSFMRPMMSGKRRAMRLARMAAMQKRKASIVNARGNRLDRVDTVLERSLKAAKERVGVVEAELRGVETQLKALMRHRARLRGRYRKARRIVARGMRLQRKIKSQSWLMDRIKVTTQGKRIATVGAAAMTNATANATGQGLPGPVPGRRRR